MAPKTPFQSSVAERAARVASFAGAALLALFAPGLFGCAPVGPEIRGVVRAMPGACGRAPEKDTGDGPPLPGARVRVRCPGGEAPRVAAVDAAGRVRADLEEPLPPGCAIEAEAPGYTPRSLPVGEACASLDPRGACEHASFTLRLLPAGGAREEGAR